MRLLRRKISAPMRLGRSSQASLGDLGWSVLLKRLNRVQKVS